MAIAMAVSNTDKIILRVSAFKPLWYIEISHKCLSGQYGYSGSPSHPVAIFARDSETPHDFSIFALMISFRVTASAANLEIPSRSFSTAMACSLKSKRKSASSLM